MAEDNEDPYLIDVEKIDLLGRLVGKTESLTFQKVANLWQIPGALEDVRHIISSIFSHGCVEDKEAKSTLWNFIFGVRVIRPDLWPDYDWKIDSEQSRSESVSQWLNVSLKSFCLSEQIWCLISDKNRLCIYFHSWAFMRCPIYTNSLLVTLQALEKNSQELLSNLDPSLMDLLNRRRLLERTNPISIPSATEGNAKKEDESSCGKRFYICDAEDKHRFSSSEELRDVVDISSLSSSLLKVSYNDELSGKDSVYPHTVSTSSQDFGQVLRSKMENFDENNSKIFHSSESDDVSLSSLVQPSSFLLKYLSSKGKGLFQGTQGNSSPNDSDLILSLDASDENSKELNIESGVDIETYSTKTESSSKENLKTFGWKVGKYTSEPKASVKYSSEDVCTNKTATLSSIDINKSIRKKPNSLNDSKYDAKHIETLPKASTSSSSTSLDNNSDSKAIGGPTSLVPNQSTASSVGSVKKRFIEDGGHSITQEADGYFPQPQPGQGLLEFLASSEFAKTCAQLDRENAHFNIAEAVLAALEQVNLKTSAAREHRFSQKSLIDESEDDVINRPAVIASVRRKPRLRSRAELKTYLSDDEPVTTDNSVFDSPDPLSSEDSDTKTTTSLDCLEGDLVDNTEAFAYTAENVGLSILRHYSSKLLPKASDLQWLVSEQDAPQKLLPIPTSIPVDPDDVQNGTNPQQSLLRGTADWAPPRPQLILTLHENLKRKCVLSSQNWRCAGCGLNVSQKLSVHFQLCSYFGRFFCTNCHTNKKSLIPAKIIHLWDFKKYAVCNFAFELLGRMANDPLFHVGSLNPRLYSLSRSLNQCQIYKLQLHRSKTYILTCTRAVSVKEKLENVPSWWYSDPEVYSLNDFLTLKKGDFLQQIKNLTTMCLRHISQCEVCSERGFICEFCRKGQPIFAFQLDAVVVCDKCGTCFHSSCFYSKSNLHCPRCVRRKMS